MGGGLLQLVAYGAQDVYLTGNPISLLIWINLVLIFSYSFFSFVKKLCHFLFSPKKLLIINN